MLKYLILLINALWHTHSKLHFMLSLNIVFNGTIFIRFTLYFCSTSLLACYSASTVLSSCNRK